MKLSDITKKHDLNFMDFKKFLTSRKFTEYNSPNKTIKQIDEPALEELALEFKDIQSKLDKDKEEAKKGGFVGSVYDQRGGRFLTIALRLTYKDLEDLGIEHTIVEEHTTIFASIIKLSKIMKSYINEFTVKKFWLLSKNVV